MFNRVHCCIAADVGFPVRSSEETLRQQFFSGCSFHTGTTRGPHPHFLAPLLSRSEPREAQHVVLSLDLKPWASHGNKSGSPSEQRTHGFDLNGRQHLPPQAASGPRLWFLDPPPPRLEGMDGGSVSLVCVSKSVTKVESVYCEAELFLIPWQGPTHLRQSLLYIKGWLAYALQPLLPLSCNSCVNNSRLQSNVCRRERPPHKHTHRARVHSVCNRACSVEIFTKEKRCPCLFFKPPPLFMNQPFTVVLYDCTATQKKKAGFKASVAVSWIISTSSQYCCNVVV